MGTSETARIGQLKEWGVFGLLYAFSNFNAEMLRRAIGHDRALLTSKNLLAESARLISDQIHPVMMVIGAVWLLGMVVWIAQARRLPRWSFDGPGLWFVLRLLLEFVIINGLLFQPSLVQPGVLLWQIVVFLPYYVIAWSWVFYRLDWVGKEQSAGVVCLSDVNQEDGFSRFDYFHSTINTLINKG